MINLRLSLCVISVLFLSCAVVSKPQFNLDNERISDIFSQELDISLVRAACVGSKGDMEAALLQGANVNVQGRYGITPLLYALHCQDFSGFNYLLENGADPNLPSFRFIYPLSAAATLERTVFLEVLLKFRADPNLNPLKSLHDAGEFEDSILVRYGDSFMPYAFGDPLMDAAYWGIEKGDWAAFDLLLSYGADINKVFPSHAPESNKNTIANFLVRQGAYCKSLKLIESGFSKNLPLLLHTIETRNPSNANNTVECRTELISKIKENITDIETAQFESDLKVYREWAVSK